MATPRWVVFFDGTCGLCNRVVDFLLERDTQGILLFSPLQGATASAWLSEHDRSSLETVIAVRLDQDKEKLSPVGEPRRKSEAVFAILREFKRNKIEGAAESDTNWIDLIFGLVAMTPHRVRDFFYDIVANNRHRLFKKSETCRLPTAADRARFLP